MANRAMTNTNNAFVLSDTEKAKRYAEALPQLASLLEGETDTVANLANFCALLHEAFRWWWTGFYRISGEQLVLGPFQGPVACTRIKKGRGVCGTAWERESTIVVKDVEEFPGHIACSVVSRSEIVVPVRNAAGQLWGVLDIDSEHLAAFSDVDRQWLERAVQLLTNKL